MSDQQDKPAEDTPHGRKPYFKYRVSPEDLAEWQQEVNAVRNKREGLVLRCLTTGPKSTSQIGNFLGLKESAMGVYLRRLLKIKKIIRMTGEHDFIQYYRLAP